MRFTRPIQTLIDQDKFQNREVGLTHPDLSSFVRLNDAGDIEIVVDERLAMIFHRASGTLTIVADQVRFLTKDSEGIRWNNNLLNQQATVFTQPALIPLPVGENSSLYAGAEDYYATADEDI